MKIRYVHCGWRNEYRSDPCSYEHYWTSSWNKAWKQFRAVRDLNPWPLRYRCSALPTELYSFLQPQCTYMLSYIYNDYSPLGGFIWNQHNDQLPVGLLAQLVERCSGIAEVMGLNPVRAWILSGLISTTSSLVFITARIASIFEESILFISIMHEVCVNEKKKYLSKDIRTLVNSVWAKIIKSCTEENCSFK